jgi:oxalate---CoA ligase
MSDALRLPDAVQTIPEAIAYWAKVTPDAPALRSLVRRRASFQELHDAMLAVAARLAALGIGREDRVALFFPPDFDACVALLGTMTHAIAVPFNPSLADPELRRDLARLNPGLLVTSGPTDAPVFAIAAELGIETLHLAQLVAPPDPGSDTHSSDLHPLHPLSAATPSERSDSPSPEAIAAIIHTSGTTGLPKRVLRSHASFLAGARAARDSSSLTAADVLLLTAWLHTNAGIVNLCAALASGGECVVATGFDPRAFPRILAAHHPTWMVSNAAELNSILAAGPAAGRETVAGPESRLRLVRAGAQAMTPGTAERAEASLRTLIFDGFGMSEGSYITASGPTRADRREGATGRPWCTEIRILGDRGEALPPGEAGEVVIRGETLFSGYLDDPETNAAVFLPGGWFRTGDLGYLDGDGYLYLIGRLNELINRGGDKIAPLEVDDAILAHPAVADAATFAVPDARLGEDIVAAVVLRPGATVTPRALRRWLLDRLTPYKVPRRIWFVTELPRTTTGKVQRRVLAERFLNGGSGVMRDGAHDVLDRKRVSE